MYYDNMTVFFVVKIQAFVIACKSARDISNYFW